VKNALLPEWERRVAKLNPHLNLQQLPVGTLIRMPAIA
jgi:hypothetical protein